MYLSDFSPILCFYSADSLENSQSKTIFIQIRFANVVKNFVFRLTIHLIVLHGEEATKATPTVYMIMWLCRQVSEYIFKTLR